MNEPESDVWTQIAPLLGGAMKQLGQKVHDAVVLRFFEGKSFQEIGAAFGASENAAKKRVAYALEKLRKYLRSAELIQRHRPLPKRFPPIPSTLRRWDWQRQFPPWR